MTIDSIHSQSDDVISCIDKIVDKMHPVHQLLFVQALLLIRATTLYSVSARYSAFHSTFPLEPILIEGKSQRTCSSNGKSRHLSPNTLNLSSDLISMEKKPKRKMHLSMESRNSSVFLFSFSFMSFSVFFLSFGRCFVFVSHTLSWDVEWLVEWKNVVDDDENDDEKKFGEESFVVSLNNWKRFKFLIVAR